MFRKITKIIVNEKRANFRKTRREKCKKEQGILTELRVGSELSESFELMTMHLNDEI